jgi:hypothetical protein
MRVVIVLSSCINAYTTLLQCYQKILQRESRATTSLKDFVKHKGFKDPANCQGPMLIIAHASCWTK